MSVLIVFIQKAIVQGICILDRKSVGRERV